MYFQGTQEEWQRVFFLAAGINIIGTIAFLMCSDVYLQPWARSNQDTLTVEVAETKELKDIKRSVAEKESDRTENMQENIPLKDDV